MIEIDDREHNKMFALMHKVSTYPEDLTPYEKKRLKEFGLNVNFDPNR